MREKLLQGIAIFISVLMLGCAHKEESQVQPYGSNRFTVTYSSIYGPSKSRAAAVRDANSYCSAKGSTMNPLDEQTTVGKFSSVTLIFSCGAAPTSPLPSSSTSVEAPSSGTTNNDARTQQMIDNDRTKRQILNHGAGGCTPNFSTGGCL